MQKDPKSWPKRIDEKYDPTEESVVRLDAIL
jgi:hypothetical protein